MVEYAKGIIVLSLKCQKCGYENETDTGSAGGPVQRAEYTVPIPEYLKANGGSYLRRASECSKCGEFFNVRAYEDMDDHYVYAKNLPGLIEKKKERLRELEAAVSSLRKVEKKPKGKHPNSRIMGRGFSCSQCGANYNHFFNYCPDCGHQHCSIDGEFGNPNSPLHYHIGLPIDTKKRGITIEENIAGAIGGRKAVEDIRRKREKAGGKGKKEAKKRG